MASHVAERWVAIMNQVSIETMGARSKFKDRRLERAGEHVSRLWFPANPGLLAKIRQGLTDGSYDLDVDFLLTEIKTDFALFTFCIREVMHAAQREKLTAPAVASPMDLLRWAGIERLKKILLDSNLSISAHEMDKMTDTQAQRLREAMMSASTAEVLAGRDKTVNEEMGFSVGLLRQLGLTLIAWNYPTVYRRAFSEQKSESTLDKELTQVLGFSPALLAMSLMEDWGLSAAVCTAVGDDLVGPSESEAPLPVEEQEIKRVAQTLQKICKVGEALARASDPEHYPSAAKDWDQAKTEIETRLGFEGLKLIQEKVRENCENYISILPHVFKSTQLIDLEEKIHLHTEKSLFRNNSFIRHCPLELKKKFKELYARVNPNQIDRQNIAMLVKEIIPFAGFEAGCIYILEPSSMMLEPRVKIGRTQLREIRSMKVKEEAAFVINSPVVENAQALNEKALASISSALGEKNRAGLIYLEIDQAELNDPKANKLLIFKAIRQAFMDCLNLE